jgi:pyruvate,water dikinase
MRPKFIRWFSEVTNRDVGLVGGKNASLGEMVRTVAKEGVAVPDGFAITAEAYFHLLDKSGVRRKIREILATLNTHNMANLSDRGKQVREAILAAPFPKDLELEIRAAYRELERREGKNVDVAVRSSATAEDLPDASFAGQQETFLNIRGEAALLFAARRCFASLFTNRAISYRHDKKFSHFKVGLSIGVQKMVRSDLGQSGVMFTLDTESGFRDTVLINAAYGLGENVVQGAVNPDEFVVFKPMLAKGFPAIIGKRIGEKTIKKVYTTDPRQPIKDVPVSKADRERFCLTDAEVLKLARWAMQIEKHYKKPMDMEWAKDGKNGKLYIVQARPETVQSRKDYSVIETSSLSRKGRVITTGLPVGSTIGQGKARVILDAKHIGQFKAGEVLVTDITDPDWEPIMKIASAIVTNRGGRTSHAAIVSRELGIPAVVGTNNATRVIKTGRKVTVSSAEGEQGKVYDGLLPFVVNKVNVKNLHRPKTKIMMILGTPEEAFKHSFLPNDGIGLCREEFITASWIGIHPMALLKYPRLKDLKAVREIAKRTKGFRSPKEFYIEKLAQGIGTMAAAFYPKPVILRFSDFKTNEYAGLVGGAEFEPHEENPMIGWRGASRYYSPEYEAAFALECAAIKIVREKFGLTNLKVMVPVCRTVEEGKKVLATMAKYGLKQHVNGLQVYVMAEVPANIILADQFAKIFDGFSIGSNDLTQLTLAVDRDSSLVSHIYDERNDAVKRLMAQLIQVAHKAGKPVGICGQAPSDYPELAKFLVEQGIDTISLNPDSVVKTTLALGKLRKRRVRR